MDLKDRVTKMHLLYLSARESFELYKYFDKYYNSNNDFYTALWVKIMQLAIKDTVIGILKFFSDQNNDKFCLKYLLREIDNKIISDEILNAWKIQISGFGEQIKNLKDLRDKSFAHTDIVNPPVNDNMNSLTIDYCRYINVEQIESMFDLIKDILVSVFKNYFNSGLDLKLNITSDTITIFKKLTEINSIEKKIRDEKIKNLIKESRKNK